MTSVLIDDTVAMMSLSRATKNMLIRTVVINRTTLIVDSS